MYYDSFDDSMIEFDYDSEFFSEIICLQHDASILFSLVGKILLTQLSINKIIEQI